MTIFIKKVSTRDKRWQGRRSSIVSFAPGRMHVDSWSVPDTEILCGGCNENLYNEEEETFGWLVYLDMRSLNEDKPYDVFCEACTIRLFPKAVVVE